MTTTLSSPQYPFWLRLLRWLAALIAFALIFAALYTLYWNIGGVLRPIPAGPGYHFVPYFTGETATANPLLAFDVPQNPYMAATVSNNMHNDGYITDTYEVSGPLGDNPRVESRSFGSIAGMCPSPNFDSNGRIVTVCVQLDRQDLYLLDADTLETLATYPMPMRPSIQQGLGATSNDTSGGAYFYLDHLDQAVIAASDLTLKVIGQVETADGFAFELVEEYDLREAVMLPDGTEDTITTTMPDWDGRYWFVTRNGIIGTVDRDTGDIQTLFIEGEEFQNSFAVGQDAVYMVSDYALYRLEADPDTGTPQVIWRETYDRGTFVKPGLLVQGSGTTPTLLGEDFVAIADNADDRTSVLVYWRDPEIEDRLVCQTPVFEEGRSATENTLIGYNDSLIIENNYGRYLFTEMMFGRTAEPGIARVDINADRTDCEVVWTNDEIGQAPVPKLSIGNGLVYTHVKADDAPPLVDAFYLAAIDFETGETVYKLLTGTSFMHANNGGPVTLGPDGTLYMSVLNGIVTVRDTDTPQNTFGQIAAARLPEILLLTLSAAIVGVVMWWTRPRNRNTGDMA